MYSPRSVRNRLRRAFAAICVCLPLGALTLASCSDGDLFSPNRNSKNSAQMALRAYYGSVSASQNAADISRIRMTVTVLPSGPTETVIVDVDPAATEWNLPMEVPANSELSVLVELISVAPGGAETVEFSGTLPVIRVTAGPQPPAPPIAVFPGPPGNLSVTAITIAPRNQSVLEGVDIPLSATVLGGSNPTVRWSSSNSAVATVSATGVVNTRLPGSATISATAGPVTDAITVTVGARATAVVISPANPTATSIGQDITVVGTLVDARNNPIAGSTVEWSVADAGVAAHLGGGVFRSARNGTTQIIATGRQGGTVLTATTTLTVLQQALSITISPTSRAFGGAGQTHQFTVDARDANGQQVANAAITWESSNPSVATVDANGLVTSVNDGTTQIRARSGTVVAAATVTVARPASIDISPEGERLTFIGATQQFSAVVRDGAGNVMDLPIVWYSQNPDIVDINAAGLAIAMGDGTATIVAEVPGLRARTTIEVRRTVTQIILDRGPFTLNAGQRQQVSAWTADERGAPVGNDPIVWSVADPSIASVSSTGLVRGLADGTTHIIATVGPHRATLAVTVVGTLPPEDFTGPYRALILSNRSFDNDHIVTNLQPRMPHVTFTKSTNVTELTPAFLSQFRVVLLFENGLTGTTGITIGNALADYVLSGGNVVLGTFYWQNRSDNPYYMPAGWGRLQTLDPFAAPVGMNRTDFYNKYEYRSATLNSASIVAHPLTEGVTALSVPFYPNGMEAKAGTTVVASYENGAPLIGYLVHSLGQRLVGVAVWPAHNTQGTISGDFWRIWTNALNWAAAGSTPATVAASAFTKPAARVTTPPAREPAIRRGGSDEIKSKLPLR